MQALINVVLCQDFYKLFKYVFKNYLVKLRLSRDDDATFFFVSYKM